MGTPTGTGLTLLYCCYVYIRDYMSANLTLSHYNNRRALIIGISDYYVFVFPKQEIEGGRDPASLPSPHFNNNAGLPGQKICLKF